jgi:hypothetical protein
MFDCVTGSYNSDAVVVNVCLLVKLLLDLSVLDLGPGKVLLAFCTTSGC